MGVFPTYVDFNKKVSKTQNNISKTFKDVCIITTFSLHVAHGYPSSKILVHSPLRSLTVSDLHTRCKKASNHSIVFLLSKPLLYIQACKSTHKKQHLWQHHDIQRDIKLIYNWGTVLGTHPPDLPAEARNFSLQLCVALLQLMQLRAAAGVTLHDAQNQGNSTGSD